MGTSVSRACTAHVRIIFAALAAFALTLTFAPSALFADDSVAGPLAGPGYEGDARSASADSSSEGPTLASTLAGSATSIVSADVALDAVDPVVGSFTVDGLTYALNDGKATLVAVSSDLQQVTNSQDADDSRVAPMLASGQVAIPASVTYNGTTYDVTAIGPYSFYLSGATDIALPASVASVDCCAFRSSDVARVEVDPDNPNLASFDGALYSADLLSLLLIPEGRAGAVLLPETAEVVEASKFSHCSLVDAISVGEGGAAFASWDGLLYSADGTTLLRVPAGATDITIRDGCTTIAAGALEGCVNLERINAPATVTSISPDVFESVPTVGLPAQMAVQDGATSGVASSLLDQAKESTDSIPQLTAMVSLVAADASSFGVKPAEVEVAIWDAEAPSCWLAAGFDAPRQLEPFLSEADIEESEAFGSALDVPVTGARLRIISGGAATSSTYAMYYQVTFDGYLSWTGSTITSSDSTVTIRATSISSMSFSNEGNFNKPGAIVERVTMPSGYWYESRHLRNSTLVLQCKGSDFLAGNTWVNDSSKAPTTYLDLNMVYSGTMVTYVPSTVNRFYMNDGSGEVTSVPSPQGSSLFLPQLDNPLWQPSRTGYAFKGWFDSATGGSKVSGSTDTPSSPTSYYAHWEPLRYLISYDLDGGLVEGTNPTTYTIEDSFSLIAPVRPGYKFLGWKGTGIEEIAENVRISGEVGDRSYVALWERVDYNLGFDTSSEPEDADYPGDAKDDQAVSIDDGQVVIEDPKRPGYVFEGWVIPTENGTEAVDQELVYQGSDGKWYVDASKLPDYAGDDGRVELTARWTSVISVDVPSSVTFYADLVTQGQESREGAASSAFGQSKVANQSQVDLRVVGLESSAVKTEGSTLGADSILKKASAATPSSSTQKLLSLYPSTKQWKPGELQDPDAVGGTKATTAVDFDLDDVLLEKSFKADDFTIPAGDALNMGYRLNLSETGQQLDYDKLSTLSEGQSASIANVSYTFAANGLPVFWTYDEAGQMVSLPKIKEDAEKISAGDAGTIEQYTRWLKNDHRFYLRWFDKGVSEADARTENDSTVYDVRIIGLNHDDKSDGTGKSGITFQFVNCLETTYRHRTSNTNTGGWGSSLIKASMYDGGIYNSAPEDLRGCMATVNKAYLNGSVGEPGVTRQVGQDRFFLPSIAEVATNLIRNIPAGTDDFDFGDLRQEGGLYAYWSDLKIGTTQATFAFLAKTAGSAGPVVPWGARSCYRGVYTYYMRMSDVSPWSGARESEDIYVSPCFCL